MKIPEKEKIKIIKKQHNKIFSELRIMNVQYRMKGITTSLTQWIKKTHTKKPSQKQYDSIS